MSMAEIVFFDVETTVPVRMCRRFWMVEFGAILVCPKKLVEVDSFCTLIRPGDLTAVAENTARCDGITRLDVASAPTFQEVADRVFNILNGRIWAGHNVERFDSARIREAFADIGRPAPVPVGIIDSLSILAHQFGRRAGNLKMATLATYFGLGQQKHRSLEDVRMNLEVLKHCAAVLLLESNLPNKPPADDIGILTRSRAHARTCGDQASKRTPPSAEECEVVTNNKNKRLGRVL